MKRNWSIPMCAGVVLRHGKTPVAYAPVTWQQLKMWTLADYQLKFRLGSAHWIPWTTDQRWGVRKWSWLWIIRECTTAKQWRLGWQKNRMIYLLSYSLELNPEQRLNSNLTQAISLKIQVRPKINCLPLPTISWRCWRVIQTRRFLLSRPTRKICHLKLFNDRVNKPSFLGFT